MFINALDCSTGLKNTGVGSCFLVPGFMKGAIRVPEDFEITEANAATLKQYLQTATLADAGDERIYPIHDFKTLTDNTEDTVMQTMGDGAQVVVRDGYYNLTFQYLDGGLCLHKNLRSWNYQGGYFLFYDDKFVIYGWRKQTAVAPGTSYVLGGIPVTVFHANKWRFNTGSEVANFSVYFSIDSTFFNESVGFIKASFNLREIKGLQTIALQQGTVAPAAGVIRVAATYGCDYANLFGKYGSELAVATLWKAFNDSTGAEIDITSVTANAATKEFIVTLDSTDPAYPTLNTGLVDIELVGPTELNTANIPGFESNTLIIQRG